MIMIFSRHFMIFAVDLPAVSAGPVMLAGRRI
jgi:hypothetical protein